MQLAQQKAQVADLEADASSLRDRLTEAERLGADLAESREKEAEVSLEAAKDGCTPIAKAMVLPRSPDEALVVDVARGLNSCDMVKQANGE